MELFLDLAMGSFTAGLCSAVFALTQMQTGDPRKPVAVFMAISAFLMLIITITLK